MPPSFDTTSRAYWGWMGLQGAAFILLIFALAPPWLPPHLQAVFMQAFAPFCHQLPARMPHIDGAALAVCDRCIGIYSGAVIGVAIGGWWGLIRRTLPRIHPVWLAAGLLPALIDWAGPWLGLWTNVPFSRSLTGLLLGAAVGLFLTASLMHPTDAKPTSA